MAEWIPPKIDYWNTPRPVGGEDYKRIEGNTQYLKEQVDGVKTRLGHIRIVRGVVRLTVEVDEYKARADITHNLGSTNVIVILHYDEAILRIHLAYEILDANTIRVYGQSGSLVNYQIIRLS